MSSLRILSFANMDGKVFAGTDGKGLLESSDGGLSWVVLSSFPSRKVRCLLADPGALYAGTDAEGVFTSEDGGQTWIGLSTGFPTDAQVFSMTKLDGALFAGLYGRGLFLWDEQTRSWSKVGDVKPLALASVGSTLIAGHNPGGLYWSGDLGVTWSKGMARVDVLSSALTSTLEKNGGELLSEAPVWEMASDDRLVFAGASAGIYYSNDQGRYWTRARRGLPDGSPGIAFLAKHEFVLAATMIQGSNGEFGGPTSGSRPIGPRSECRASHAVPAWTRSAELPAPQLGFSFRFQLPANPERIEF